jgi:predicted aspartyl protease
MLYPQLELAFQHAKGQKPSLQSCLIDTGFDNFLIINQSLADKIGFKAQYLTHELSPYSKKPVPREIGEVEIALTLEEGEQYIFQVEAILFPNEPTPIIGSKFLQKICKELDCQLTFDYHRDKVILH